MDNQVISPQQGQSRKFFALWLIFWWGNNENNGPLVGSVHIEVLALFQIC